MTSLEISRLHAELTKILSNPAMPADMLEQGSAFKVLLESNYDVAATGRRPPETKPRASQKQLVDKLKYRNRVIRKLKLQAKESAAAKQGLRIANTWKVRTFLADPIIPARQLSSLLSEWNLGSDAETLSHTSVTSVRDGFCSLDAGSFPALVPWMLGLSRLCALDAGSCPGFLCLGCWVVPGSCALDAGSCPGFCSFDAGSFPALVPRMLGLSRLCALDAGSCPGFLCLGCWAVPGFLSLGCWVVSGSCALDAGSCPGFVPWMLGRSRLLLGLSRLCALDAGSCPGFLSLGCWVLSRLLFFGCWVVPGSCALDAGLVRLCALDAGSCPGFLCLGCWAVPGSCSLDAGSFPALVPWMLGLVPALVPWMLGRSRLLSLGCWVLPGSCALDAGSGPRVSFLGCWAFPSSCALDAGSCPGFSSLGCWVLSRLLVPWMLGRSRLCALDAGSFPALVPWMLGLSRLCAWDAGSCPGFLSLGCWVVPGSCALDAGLVPASCSLDAGLVPALCLSSPIVSCMLGFSRLCALSAVGHSCISSCFLDVGRSPGFAPCMLVLRLAC